MPKGVYQRPPIELTFWSRLKPNGECLEWSGARGRRGYGVLRFMDNMWQAHRVSWVLSHGHIPDGLYVCHSCDNPPCCNPAHLFLGSARDNTADMVRKGRSTRKLSIQEVVAIRARYSAGSANMTELAREYGVGATAIHNIVRHQKWRHFAGEAA